MRKYIKYGVFALCALALASCQDVLDTHPTSSFDDDAVWGSKATADAFVNATYSNVMGIWAGSSASIGWEARTPNCVMCSQVGEGIDGFALESISNTSDYGANRSSILRSCNLIIEKVEASTTLTADEKTALKAEGYFLRGMVFFDQARKMGRFLPIKQVLSQDKEAEAKIAMTKDLKESWKVVTDDLQEAVKGLPKTAASGRATKYAAEVILSRAALQAYAYTNEATYLDMAINAANDVITNSGSALTSNYGGMFQNSGDTDKEILLARYWLNTNVQCSSFDEIQRTAPNISIDDQKLSKSPNLWKMAKAAKTFEAWGVYWPSQDLVDQYLVIDQATGEALPWYETSQFKNNVDVLDASTVTAAGQIDSYERTNGEQRNMPTAADLSNGKSGYPLFARYYKVKADATEKNISTLMYANRDKRFAASVVYDQGPAFNGEVFETNHGGNAFQGVRDKEDGGWYNTTTGYYWRKYVVDDADPNVYASTKTNFHMCVARLGEAYLNLAEAYLLKKEPAKAVEAFNNTRRVHGGLPDSEATTLADAWADYIRERNCEMTNEIGDIYFSYLRWGKYGGDANHGRPAGDIVYDLDRPAYKIEINRDRTAVLVGQATLLNGANRMFTTKRYLLPINKGFLDTREAYGLDHDQNPGW